MLQRGPAKALVADVGVFACLVFEIPVEFNTIFVVVGSFVFAACLVVCFFRGRTGLGVLLKIPCQDYGRHPDSWSDCQTVWRESSPSGVALCTPR